MAIQIINDLLPINPVYNDSIIRFSSDSVLNPTRAEVEIGGVSQTFPVVPFGGLFTFNFKEIVKSLLNTNRFEDGIVPNLGAGNYIYSDSTLSRTVNVTLRVIGTTTDALNKSYRFTRGVEQLPDYHHMASIAAPVRVLLPTKNYVDYYCKYYEGYPFDFAVYGIPTFATYYLKNVTTNKVTPTYTNSNFGLNKRIFISDGANSTTETDLLIQSSTLNKLELYVNGQFVANIYVTKVESDCGIQIKWVNSKGAYSYWKFDRAYKSTITPRTIDDFEGRYDNLQNLKSSSYLIGKTATQTINVNSIYTAQDAEYLADLFYSPAVWMNVNEQPFQKQEAYTYMGVKLNDAAFGVIDTKSNKGKMNLTITLPELNTIIN